MKFIKYKIIILVTLLLNVKIVSSQEMDTALIKRHIKIRLFTELQLGLLNETTLNDYYKRELKATIVNSKGFKNLIFFKISNQILAVDTFEEGKKVATYKTPICLKNGDECYFIVAFNKINTEFSKLKGTKENDFDRIYSDLQDKWIYWKPINKIDDSLIYQFEKDYWVEGLDIGCLLRSLKAKKGICLEYFSPELIVH